MKRECAFASSARRAVGTALRAVLSKGDAIKRTAGSAVPACVVVQCALLFVAMCAQAAGPLTAEIRPLALRPRTGAPETLEVTLNWTGSGLLEGALELTFPSGDEGSPQYRSHDLALTGGAQNFRLLVPATSQDGGFTREVRARFVTTTDAIDLGRFDWGTRQGNERTFTICVSKPRLRGAAQDFALWQSLRIERFQPATTGYNNAGASTLPVHVETEEMPATALGYTPYDIVLLEGEGFTLLREKQLAALSKWVLAGGSVCLATSEPLDAAHRGFIEGLLAADVHEPPLAFDAEGRVAVKEEGGSLLARPGFGRLVVAAPGPQSNTEVETANWTRAVTHLWKFRRAQAEAILEEGKWRWPTDRKDSYRRYNELQQQLANILAPKQVRILPYPIVLLVLAAFVVVIGPLDWIVLGRLRMRRLTWVTFPLAAVACTALTVFLAENYMGRSNHRSALTITDLGHDGRILRETRFEMLFPARNQDVTTDVRNALCVPMSVSYGVYYGNRPASASPPRYEGLFPTGYKVRQSLRQWTPQMNRLTSFDAGEDKSGMPWEKLDPQDLSVGNLRNRLGSNAGIELYVIRSGEILGLESGSLYGFILALCQSRDFRWPGIFTVIGPNGSANFEDLALVPVTFDPERVASAPPRLINSAPYTPEESEVNATIVVRREGENVHIYRRLYAP